MEKELINDSISFHLTQPEITLEKHVKKQQIKLGESVNSKYRIYLDTKFWILFRDAELNRNEDRSIHDLLNTIKYLVSYNLAVCPISQATFMELMKQDDSFTRNATAKLIDLLSLGTTLVMDRERICQEICNAIYTQSGAKNLIPTKFLIWTKLPYVLGTIHPNFTGMSESYSLAAKKAFFDYMWDIPLTELSKSIDGIDNFRIDWEEIAGDINLMNEKHKDEIKSFAQLYRREFEGCLSLFEKEILMMYQSAIKEGFLDFHTINSTQTFNQKFLKFSKSIPTLQITASCYAAVRWDNKRKLHANDLLDFHHAEAALAYCDLFITEKPLKSLLTQGHLGLTNTFSCVIASNAKDALNAIHTINFEKPT